MGRLWQRVAVFGLLTLVLVLGVGVAVYYMTLPHFVAALLTRVTGRAVELESVGLRPSSMLVVEVRGLRVYEGPEPAGPVWLELRELVGRHAWARLFAGELIPRDWSLRGGYFQIVLGDNGGRAPADLLALPVLDISVAETRIDLLLPGHERLRLDDLSLELRRAESQARISGTGHSWLSDAERRVGEVDMTFDLARSEGRARLAIRDVRLDALPRGPLAAPEGRLNGTLLLQRDGDRLAVDYDLAVDGFRIQPESFSAPLAAETTELRGRAELETDALHVALETLRLDDLRLEGEAELGPGPDRRLRGALRFADFEPGRPAGTRVQPVSLLGLRFATFARVNQRIEAGRVERATIDLDVPLAGLPEALGFERRLEPHELRIRAHLRDGVYRPNPGSAPLVDMSGDFEIEGNVLRISKARMWREGSPLPQIDVELDGMHRLVRLPRAERGIPAGPGVPIPGLGPATRSLRAAAEPGGPALVFELVDVHLAHPAFLLALRDGRGRLRFPDGKLAIDSMKGVLGGAPATIDGVWDPDGRTVEARIVYGDGTAPPPSRKAPGNWVSARARTDSLPIGPWRVVGASGRIRAYGAFVEVRDVTGDVAGGAFEAQGTVSLEARDEAPYGFTIELADANASRMGPSLGLAEGTLEGGAWLQGSLTGRLAPERPFLAGAHLGASFEVREGRLARLPATVVLARLPSLQGVRGLFGQALPFDSIRGQFTLDRGVLRTQDFALEGPELRMLAAGEIDVLSSDQATDLVVAMLFLETIDRMIGQVPLVGRWVLGDDRNLIALYIHLQGPWREPRAQLVAPSALQTAAGWAGNMIGQGARRLRSIFAGETGPAGSQN